MSLANLDDDPAQSLYVELARPLLFLFPAETAHRLVVESLALLCRIPVGLWLLERLAGEGTPALPISAMGLDFEGPVGLAAGLDKDALAFEAFVRMGFGFVEVGTVTGQAQPGNPVPRLFRLPADRALVNRMGFNNRGAEQAAQRLARRSGVGVVGANIGRSKLVPNAEATEDYVKSTRALAPHIDYLVVNVSSPNTPGLRALQDTEALRPLLRHVRATLDAAAPGRQVPLLVKIAPDLADEDVDAVADLALSEGLAGIIATNTTIGRQGLRTRPDEVEACGAGGLSGAPLKQRSLEVLERLWRRVGGKLTLISVGGIETVDDAWQRILAGATLIQVYTALIYQGPAWVSALNRGIAERLEHSGFERLEDAVGSGARRPDTTSAPLASSGVT